MTVSTHAKAAKLLPSLSETLPSMSAKAPCDTESPVSVIVYDDEQNEKPALAPDMPDTPDLVPSAPPPLPPLLELPPSLVDCGVPASMPDMRGDEADYYPSYAGAKYQGEMPRLVFEYVVCNDAVGM